MGRVEQAAKCDADKIKDLEHKIIILEKTCRILTEMFLNDSFDAINAY